MPDPAQPRRPDAIRCPRDYPRDPKVDRDVARNLLFGPVLGCRRVWSRELVDRPNESLVTPNLGPAHDLGRDTMYQPKGHPDAGEHRHEWFIAEQRSDKSFAAVAPEIGDPAETGRIKLGYLIPDPYADDEQTQAKIQDAYEERLAEYRASPEFVARLKALGCDPVTAPGAGEVADPRQADLRPAPSNPLITPAAWPESKPVPESER